MTTCRPWSCWDEHATVDGQAANGCCCSFSDARTGHTLLLQDDLPTDRIVQAWYDPSTARLELRGLKSRIEIAFQAE